MRLRTQERGQRDKLMSNMGLTVNTRKPVNNMDGLVGTISSLRYDLVHKQISTGYQKKRQIRYIQNQ